MFDADQLSAIWGEWLANSVPGSILSIGLGPGLVRLPWLGSEVPILEIPR